MKRLFLFCFLVFFSFNLFSQKSTSIGDSVILWIEEKPIYASEFIYMLDKNNSLSDGTKYTTESFLEMFVNFKLKVHDAIAQGIDTTLKFRREYNSYRNRAIRPYMQDSEAIEQLARVAYSRMCRDRYVAHIALACSDSASQAHKDSVYHAMEIIRQRVTTGLPAAVKQDDKKDKKKKGKDKDASVPESFYAVAAEVSQTSAQDSGRIGWVTPFRFVYEFENMAYNTPIGQVSEIFKTAYGYHILLVDREVPHEEVNVSHIMKRLHSWDTLGRAKQTIDSIYKMLERGDDFATLAIAMSDDGGTNTKGGELGWTPVGRMVTPFEEAIFRAPVGSFTKPFKTDFGWHIAKIHGRRGVKPYDSLRSDIMQQLVRDGRILEAQRVFVEKARREHHLSDTLTPQEVYKYMDEHVEEEHPEIKNLIREYHDGLLLFEVSSKEVWEKAIRDTAGLRQFFEKNKKDLAWEPHFKGIILQCKDEMTQRVARNIIANTSEPDSVISNLQKRLVYNSVEYAKFEKGIWKRGESAIVDKFGFGDARAPFEPASDFPVVSVEGKVIKSPEEYKDVETEIVSIYQKYLDNEWIRNMLKKYKPKINKFVVDAIKAEKG